MEETYLLNVEGVKKKILHGGYGGLPHFQDGSKVTFHFQTLKDNFERTVIDDSRRAGVPMEIIVGKMFKIEVWETLLTSMRIGEVAEYWCDAIHTGMYALVSKGMRKIAEGRDPLEGQKHRCGMGNMFDYHSTGYADLDDLQREPQPLIFIMELFKVEDPSSYKRDTWAMSKDEKLLAVPKLHTEGNRLVLSRKFKEAAEKYQEAVICLRNVQAKEKPQEEEWVKLENLITPLVLNYCQCQLELGEYYEVLEHTTDLLQKNSKNVKAYFKRAKAHAAIWNEKEAREDFMRVAYLDPSLAAAVRKELKILGERMRQKHVEERKRYQGLFQQPLHKKETEQSRAAETGELPKGKEPLPGCSLGRAEMEGNDPEANEPKKRGEIGAGSGEPEPGSVEEEKGGILVGREMGNKDFASPEEIRMTAQVESEVRDQGTAPNYSAHNGTEGESSCRRQQPDVGQQGADREGGNAEDSCSQKDAAGFARPKEDGERRTGCGGFEEAVGGAAGSAMISRGGGPVEGPCGPGQCPTTQDSSGKREECEECGEVGTPAGVLPRTQDQAARGPEDVAEGARGKSAGRGSEGGGIQPLCEGSGREAKGAAAELQLREAAGSDWGSPGGWRERASGGKDKMGDEME
ncbi:aryl-hydrocarbon-interacting protein-like 1 [Varanus komodoensis]|uniref:aryl-hydrocarbon-interacting protein-like 1 n=1 Tax=Varanus komodoensis TaxID=61221 RepID=UPI001CF76DB4|nr:aryl-hydrocarbon-interacting protein-like 1 [Varanus komodoensis]